MPIYEYSCGCGCEITKLQMIGAESPKCPTCGVSMNRKPTRPAIVRVLEKGGYPVRSKGYKKDYSKEYLKDVSPQTQ